jgi:uncharacterized protein YceK
MLPRIPGGLKMSFRAFHVALLFSSLFVGGCGTCANLVMVPPPAGGKTPFGGVRQDMECMTETTGQDSAYPQHPDAEVNHFRRSALKLLCAVDLPFSLVGDVVTWPYTASYTVINSPVPVPPMAQSIPQQWPASAAPATLPAPAAYPESKTQPEPKAQP